MARGKYSNRAEAAKARQDLANELRETQRRLRDVTRERDALLEMMSHSKEQFDKEIARLSGQLDEGTSDQVNRIQKVADRVSYMGGRKAGEVKGLIGFQRSFMRRFAAYVAQQEDVSLADAYVKLRSMLPKQPPPGWGSIDSLQAEATVDLLSAGIVVVQDED